MQFDSYQIKSDHRNNSRSVEKSQWAVDRWREVLLFAQAKKFGWATGGKNVLWAVENDGGALTVLGTDGSAQLVMAKYICDANSQWHGYPVLPKKHDIPPSVVLKAWKDSGLINNKQLNRWSQGKA